MDLDVPYEISVADKQYYTENGFVVARNIFDSTFLDSYRQKIMQVVTKIDKEQDNQGRITDYSTLFQQVTNIWRHDEDLKGLVLSKRLGKIAADLMGVKGTRLYHDQVLIKKPQSPATPWHQDQYFWPLDSPNAITMWLALVDVTVDMGTMRFIPMHQCKGEQFTKIPISDESDKYFQDVIDSKNYEDTTFAMKAGDATYHSGWTIHSAFGNKSDINREILTIIYFEDGIRIGLPENEHQKVDMEVFLPGRQPGDIADTHLNPITYTTDNL